MTTSKRHLAAERISSESEFLDFVSERQAILARRIAGEPFPWTENEMLRKYRFGNIDRADDPGTKFILSVCDQFGSASDFKARNALLNVVAYRLFNKRSTFESFGPLHVGEERIAEKVYISVNQLRQAGESVFTAAHQTTPRFKGIDSGDKVMNYALLIAWFAAWSHNNATRLCKKATLAAAMRELEGLSGMGTYVGAQVAQDLASCGGLTTFTLADPMPLGRGGSRYALSMMYGPASKTEQQEQFEELAGVTGMWQTVCENALCEFSKYVRIKNGSAVGRLYEPRSSADRIETD